MGPFHYYPDEARDWLAKRYGVVKADAAPGPADQKSAADSQEN
jgi:hypothetical protein